MLPSSYAEPPHCYLDFSSCFSSVSQPLIWISNSLLDKRQNDLTKGHFPHLKNPSGHSLCCCYGANTLTYKTHQICPRPTLLASFPTVLPLTLRAPAIAFFPNSQTCHISSPEPSHLFALPGILFSVLFGKSLLYFCDI